MDRQTSRQGPARYPAFIAVFSWQLQLNRHGLSAPQTLPSPAQGLPRRVEAFQGQKHPEPSTSRHGAAVTSGTAPAGWGPGAQEGVPGAPRWLGRGSSPVPWCCQAPPRAVGFPGHGSRAGSSSRLSHCSLRSQEDTSRLDLVELASADLTTRSPSEQHCHQTSKFPFTPPRGRCQCPPGTDAPQSL